MRNRTYTGVKLILNRYLINYDYSLLYFSIGNLLNEEYLYYIKRKIE